jgi:hypothetical protein
MAVTVQACFSRVGVAEHHHLEAMILELEYQGVADV